MTKAGRTKWTAKALSTAGALLSILAWTALAQNPAIYEGGSGAHHAESPAAYGSITYPQVKTTAATGVTDQVAWLNGMLTCTSASPTTVHAYWGTTDRTNDGAAWEHWTNFGRRAAWTNLTTNISVNANTRYYYRFYAANNEGAAWSWPVRRFKSFSPPTVINRTPFLLTSASATLNGRLTAGGTAYTRVYFGPDTNHWAATNHIGWVGEGAFATNMTKLTPSTLYFFRCYGSNAYGIDWSPVTSFRTGSDAIFLGGNGDEYDAHVEMSRATKVIRGSLLVIW